MKKRVRKKISSALDKGSAVVYFALVNAAIYVVIIKRMIGNGKGKRRSPQ